MTTAPDAVAATADLCPECGYDRRASGAGRPCSECGYEQPADELVAWGRSHIDTRGGWRPLLPALFMVPMFVLLEALRDSLNGWGFLAVVGVAVGLADWWKRTRPRPATAGPQQLRLSPRGFAVRTGFGPVGFKPWKPGYRVRLRNTLGGSPEVVVESPFVGPIVLAQPLVFRPARGEVGEVAARIKALLNQQKAVRAADEPERCNR